MAVSMRSDLVPLGRDAPNQIGVDLRHLREHEERRLHTVPVEECEQPLRISEDAIADQVMRTEDGDGPVFDINGQDIPNGRSRLGPDIRDGQVGAERQGRR